MRLFLFVLLLAAAPTRAQDFSSDRPGFANTPLVVPVGTFQIESGATTIQGGGYRLPDALIRVALIPAFEARVLLPSLLDGETATDAEVGFKMALSQGEGVKTALLAAVAIGVADGVEAGSIGGAFTSAFAVGGGWSATAQGGATYLTQDDILLSGALAAGRALDAQISTYVEAFTTFEADDLSPTLTLQHGYALLLTPTMQIDASVAVGVTTGLPDWQVSVGWTGRF